MTNRPILTDVLRRAAGLRLLPHRLRPALLRLSGVGVGEQVLVMSGLLAPRRGRITIGNNVFVNYDAYFDAEGEIVIEDGVQIADHVRILTSTHEIAGADRRAGRSLALPVRVGRGTWIGSSAVVLPGVEIAPGCVIAAGAVVTASTEADGLYAGVPARRVRDLVAG